ncbi:hypothetical protein [Kutzneria chonburiensis]|uniref:Uncharacterized protein n=1 Tax=Kutzneria chonburiensis TaxID=1483604 RepID=A0ABV6N0B1_9PSEU|nr:hypothetical protein [Kutzneria chonburiensis]
MGLLIVVALGAAVGVLLAYLLYRKQYQLAGAVVALVAVVLVLTGLPLDSNPIGAPPTTSPPATAGSNPDDSTQHIFQTTVVGDQQYLIDGYVSYPDKVTTDVDQAVIFSASVCGSASRRCGGAPAPLPATPSTSTTAQAPTKIGARIRGHLTSDAPAQIDLDSTEIQPVLRDTDRAVWSWTVKPSASGSYTLTATFTPLRADTAEPLAADTQVSAVFEVRQTTGHAVGSVWTVLSSGLTAIIASLSALGITGVAVWTWLRRKKTKAAEPAKPAKPGRKRRR